MSDEKISLSQPLPAPGAGAPIPSEVAPLPSEGLVYPPGHPLHHAKWVDIKAMTAREEDILTSRALIKTNRVINTLLRSCILNPDIDPMQLLVGDRNAILIAIRISGYGPEYKVAITCPSCDKSSEQEVDLSSLPLKGIPEDAQSAADGANAFEVVLPKSGAKCTFKLLTGADEAELMAMNANATKAGINDQIVTNRLKIQVLSINGETDRTKLAAIINSMPARDSRAIRKAADRITPGVELKYPFVCPECGHAAEEVEVPLGTEFFWPGS